MWQRSPTGLTVSDLRGLDAVMVDAYDVVSMAAAAERSFQNRLNEAVERCVAVSAGQTVQ